MLLGTQEYADAIAGKMHVVKVITRKLGKMRHHETNTDDVGLRMEREALREVSRHLNAALHALTPFKDLYDGNA